MKHTWRHMKVRVMWGTTWHVLPTVATFSAAAVCRQMLLFNANECLRVKDQIPCGLFSMDRKPCLQFCHRFFQYVNIQGEYPFNCPSCIQWISDPTFLYEVLIRRTRYNVITQFNTTLRPLSKKDRALILLNKNILLCPPAILPYLFLLTNIFIHNNKQSKKKRVLKHLLLNAAQPNSTSLSFPSSSSSHARAYESNELTSLILRAA